MSENGPSHEESEINARKTEWTEQQLEMRKLVILKEPEELKKKLLGESFIAGGLDISFSKKTPDLAVACLAIYRISEFKLLHSSFRTIHLTVPYIPYFLAFRECEVFEELVTAVLTTPDIVPDILMVDGNGTLHPRGFGSACHLGVRLNMPAIGVAKKLLNVFPSVTNNDGLNFDELRKALMSGKHLDETGRFEIKNADGEVCGVALQNCAKSKRPVFVSPGHLISLSTACEVTTRCSKYRAPEPIRQADLLSRKMVESVDKEAQE